MQKFRFKSGRPDWKEEGGNVKTDCFKTCVECGRDYDESNNIIRIKMEGDGRVSVTEPGGPVDVEWLAGMAAALKEHIDEREERWWETKYGKQDVLP